MEYLDKKYTEKGQKDLHIRLKSLAKIYFNSKTTYPYSNMMFGFPLLKIRSKVHLEGMMDELSQILNIKMED